MGIFATFCGICYNDFMSIPLFLYESCYPVGEHHAEMIQKEDCVYPIGVDPAWYLSKNELNYLNSLKMKLSVIIGVLQMSLGVCLKGINALYFKNKLDFFLEFVPQITLLLVLFGYMDLLIINKWLCDFTNIEYMAPSVISTMINMFLGGGALEPGTMAVISG